MELRKYQKEAMDKVLAEWDSGVKKTLVIAATGTGKTILFAKIAEHQANIGHRVLVLAHRDELIQQAASKIYSVTRMNIGIEKATETCLNGDFDVVIGSVQSMSKESRLQKFSKNYFQDIIVDEAHHCTANSYQSILNYFEGANILGVTATPERNDERSLSKYFQSVAYEYPLIKGIHDGYLCPLKTRTIQIKMDLRHVHTSNGDYQLSELGDTIEPYFEKVVQEMTKYCKDRKTVVFLPLIETSQKFCKILNKYGFRATEVNGKSNDRTEALKKFENGEYNVLCNAMLLTEGWDCPSVDCCIVLRPTKSIALYTQMVGRVMRLFQGKKDALLLDFLWQTKDYDLCHPSSLLISDEEIAKRMDEIVAKSTNDIDIEEASNLANESVMREREAALKRELMRQELERRRQNSINNWKSSINCKNGVNPIQYCLSIFESSLSNYKPKFEKDKEEPTRKQLEFIAKRGIDIMNIESFGFASKLIKKIIERQNCGYTTPKQIRILESFGFVRVGQWSFNDASEMIDKIYKNKWTVPKDINTEEYSERMILHYKPIFNI